MVSCFEDALDPVDYASIGAIASGWHNLCDSVVTAQPATPALSSVTARKNRALCFDTVLSLCQSATVLLA